MAQYEQFQPPTGRSDSGRARVHPSAFNALAAELVRPMTAHAARLLGSSDEAQDAVQEALLIAFTHLDQLRDPTRFPAWLKAIVTSQCHRQLRRRGREVSLDGLERFEPLAPKSAEPATSYEWFRLRVAVDQAMDRLSPPLRAACRLYYVQGHSVAEIADILEQKPGTVRKRLHSAQARLGKMLAGHLGGGPSIRVGYLSISDHLLGMVAHRLHKGRDSGIRMKRFLSWNALADALTAGRIDAAFIMAPLAMKLCSSGTRLRYILDGHHDGSALAASTKKLQGKLVGVPGPYSTHRVLLGKLARDFPRLWNDISMADTHPSYAIRSLRAHEIDAFFCAEPWSTKCAFDGDGDVVISSKDVAPGHPCCVVAVRDDFCRANGETVHGFARALLEARDKLRADLDYCAKTQSMYTGIPSDLAKSVLESGTVTFEDLRPDKARMADFMHLALASGVLREGCDLDSFVCTDFF